MFRTHGKLMTFGDMNRIKRYYKVFKNWDESINSNPLFSIYPEFLSES